MVDTSSSDILPSGDVVTISVNNRDSAADISYSQAMSLIKLRQKGAIKMNKLPIGVFRCILEYQFPMFFSLRYSDPCAPIKGQQDRHFPATNKLDYDNYLVAINEIHED